MIEPFFVDKIVFFELTSGISHSTMVFVSELGVGNWRSWERV